MRAQTCVSVAAVAMLTTVGCGQAQVSTPRPQAAVKGSGTVIGLRMIDSRVGWAYGGLRLARTADSGHTFKDVTPPGVDGAAPTVDARRVIRSHDFVGDNRAWVLVGTVSAQATEDLERTADGGVTWTKVTTIAPEGGAALVTFVDERHGWLVEGRWITDCSNCAPSARETSLLLTTDGGASWTETYRTVQHFSGGPMVSVTGPASPGIRLQPIADCGWWSPAPQFVSSSVGFIGLSCPGAVAPMIARTADGGRTWEQVELPPPPGTLGPAIFTNVDRVHFFSNEKGVAFVSRCAGSGPSCSPSGAMLETDDGGAHWSVGEGVQGQGLDFVFADESHAWLPEASLTGASADSLLVTDNAGASWLAVTLPASLAFPQSGGRQLQLVTPSLGFGLIWTASAPDTRFFRTTNGGRTFEPFSPAFA